jgi:hypothetical protein
MPTPKFTPTSTTLQPDAFFQDLTVIRRSDIITAYQQSRDRLKTFLGATRAV